MDNDASKADWSARHVRLRVQALVLSAGIYFYTFHCTAFPAEALIGNAKTTIPNGLIYTIAIAIYFYTAFHLFTRAETERLSAYGGLTDINNSLTAVENAMSDINYKTQILNVNEFNSTISSLIDDLRSQNFEIRISDGRSLSHIRNSGDVEYPPEVHQVSKTVIKSIEEMHSFLFMWLNREDKELEYRDIELFNSRAANLSNRYIDAMQIISDAGESVLFIPNALKTEVENAINERDNIIRQRDDIIAQRDNNLEIIMNNINKIADRFEEAVKDAPALFERADSSSHKLKSSYNDIKRALSGGLTTFSQERMWLSYRIPLLLSLILVLMSLSRINAGDHWPFQDWGHCSTGSLNVVPASNGLFVHWK